MSGKPNVDVRPATRDKEKSQPRGTVAPVHAGPPAERQQADAVTPTLDRPDDHSAVSVDGHSAVSLSASLCLLGVAGNNPRIVEALEAYLEVLGKGHPCSRDEFLAQNADISAALEQCLSGLELIHHAAAQLASGPPPSSASDPTTGLLPPYARLGDYRILREVGRGGMGVVYEAEQVSLGRRVALKVLPFSAAIDPKQRQRFQIEAQAAAQLHHPHIVPIFGVGCDRGIHYYAMQFVEGRSLAAILREARSENGGPAGGLSTSTSAWGPASVERRPAADQPHSSASDWRLIDALKHSTVSTLAEVRLTGRNAAAASR